MSGSVQCLNAVMVTVPLLKVSGCAVLIDHIATLVICLLFKLYICDLPGSSIFDGITSL